jgi:predicted secreted hydrolase
MKSSWLAAAIVLSFAGAALAAQFRVALPGYQYQFPRDHFAHPEFQTEWWYYTGNLQAPDGHQFGFELTFFRQGVNRENHNPTPWELQDLYFAHLALSDLDGQSFFHFERANRAGPGIAGASETERAIWNGNWRSSWHDTQEHLEAITDEIQLDLMLQSRKPPVIHGENGVSQKAEGPGRASHYISLTRLQTVGQLTLRGKRFAVSGSSWMDHEFFTHQLTPEQAGWDWISVQLENDTELMLFLIRRKDGSIDPYSSGTFVDASGRSHHLRKGDFVLEPEGETWRSPVTSAAYPMRWRVAVPQIGLALEVTTSLKSQELAATSGVLPAYWEGAIRAEGRKNSAPRGVGYLEMTGYDRPVDSLR